MFPEPEESAAHIQKVLKNLKNMRQPDEYEQIADRNLGSWWIALAEELGDETPEQKKAYAHAYITLASGVVGLNLTDDDKNTLLWLADIYLKSADGTLNTIGN